MTKLLFLRAKFGPKLDDYDKILVVLLLLRKASTHHIYGVEADTDIKKESTKNYSFIVKMG